MAVPSASLAGLPPGECVLGVELTDDASGRRVQAREGFTIVS